jgi:hypothetical protein
MYLSHLGGVVDSVLATGPQGLQVQIQLTQWIFKGNKIPQHISFRWEVKLKAP